MYSDVSDALRVNRIHTHVVFAVHKYNLWRRIHPFILLNAVRLLLNRFFVRLWLCGMAILLACFRNEATGRPAVQCLSTYEIC